MNYSRPLYASSVLETPEKKTPRKSKNPIKGYSLTKSYNDRHL
jgi:hypothetical protein